jgi:hypothetical protein
MKRLQIALQSFFLVIVVLIASAFALMLRLLMYVGIGKSWYYGIIGWMNSLIPLNILEHQPSQYPTPDSYHTGGHIRFTAKRTHNVKGEPLNLEEVDSMLYIARVNFPERLIDPSEATLRQLRYALTKRQLDVKKVYLYGPQGEAMDKVIKL